MATVRTKRVRERSSQAFGRVCRDGHETAYRGVSMLFIQKGFRRSVPRIPKYSRSLAFRLVTRFCFLRPGCRHGMVLLVLPSLSV